LAHKYIIIIIIIIISELKEFLRCNYLLIKVTLLMIIEQNKCELLISGIEIYGHFSHIALG